MPHYAPDHLKTLEIDPDDFYLLAEDVQIRTIKQAYRKLSAKYHPDKPDTGNNDTFVAINKAYRALTDDGVALSVDYAINSYFRKTALSVPLTGFDLFMEEQIKEAFQGLLKEFDALGSEKEKQQFAEYYAPFLTIAEKLEEEAEPRMKARTDSFRQMELLNYLLLETRKLAIRLFAEESLDDFSYREFMAFGLKSSKPFFATRKLLSPLKWIAAIIGALDILTRGTADYIAENNFGTAFIAYFFTAPFYAAHVVIELLASPVNQISRPLSDLIGLPPAVFTSLIGAISLSVIYELMMGAISLSLTSAMLFVPYVNMALGLYSLYSTYELCLLVEKRGSSADALALACAFSFVCVFLMIPSDTLISNFLNLVGNLCAINKITEIVGRTTDEYPFAQEVISEELREATLLGYKTAHQSHRFFNTPKEATCDNHPSFLQKTGRFFGFDDSTVHPDPKPWCANAAEPAPHFSALSLIVL